MNVARKWLLFICIVVFSRSYSNNKIIYFQWIKSDKGAVKSDFLISLKNWFEADTFIETGTFGGETLANAVSIFDTIHSVELSHEFYDRACNRYAHNKNIRLHYGNSPSVLTFVLPCVSKNPIIWLDAHYCGIGTARGSSDSPILQELEVLKSKPESIILIDDLRGFYHENWPSLKTVTQALKAINSTYHIVMLADSIIAYPSNCEIEISPFLQACTTSRLFDTEEMGYCLEEVLQAENSLVSMTNTEQNDFQIFSTFIKDSDDHYGRLWQGLMLENSGDYSAAIELFKKIIENVSPRTLKHWRVSYYLARCYYNSGNTATAKEIINSMPLEAFSCPYTKDVCTLILQN